MSDQVVLLSLITTACQVRVEAAPEGWERTRGKTYNMYLRNGWVDFLEFPGCSSSESIPPNDIPKFQVAIIPKPEK